MPAVRIALAQTNSIVGDIQGNLAKCFQHVSEAASQGANLVLFPEMVVSGYPIEDLAASESFLNDCVSAVKNFAVALEERGLGHVVVVLGTPAPVAVEHRSSWAIAQNTAVIIRDGKVWAGYAKHHLPNYSVFDEYRIFIPGDQLISFELEGLKFSMLICEDIWQEGGPVAKLSEEKSDVALVLNGSPFQIDKDDVRVNLVKRLAKNQNVAVAYVNLVGGQDDLVFDGDSLMVDADQNLIGRGPQFEEGLVVFDIDSKTDVRAASTLPTHKQDDNWQVWNALTLGLRDYVNKNGFKSVILGLSGGIDSAVCAALAVDALGASRVFGVSLPSKYSSDHSKSDAFDLAKRLGISIRTEPIKSATKDLEKQLKLNGLAAENLQARIRGTILMSLSNQEGHLTLTTGNKSELAVGYSTIYGDSVGGYAPIKDVAKTLVWQLAKWRNDFAVQNGKVAPIPENSITKPPSAELRPGQVDQDSLPDYDILDAIIEQYVGARLGADEIKKNGFDAETVDRVIGLIDRAEWKRRQGAIGPKITGMSFGRDRRLPITNKYR
ncbi:MAG: NAD+ synthase [Micrococcales bacterium]